MMLQGIMFFGATPVTRPTRRTYRVTTPPARHLTLSAPPRPPRRQPSASMIPRRTTGPSREQTFNRLPRIPTNLIPDEEDRTCTICMHEFDTEQAVRLPCCFKLIGSQCLSQMDGAQCPFCRADLLGPRTYQSRDQDMRRWLCWCIRRYGRGWAFMMYNRIIDFNKAPLEEAISKVALPKGSKEERRLLKKVEKHFHEVEQHRRAWEKESEKRAITPKTRADEYMLSRKAEKHQRAFQTEWEKLTAPPKTVKEEERRLREREKSQRAYQKHYEKYVLPFNNYAEEQHLRNRLARYERAHEEELRKLTRDIHIDPEETKGWSGEWIERRKAEEVKATSAIVSIQEGLLIEPVLEKLAVDFMWEDDLELYIDDEVYGVNGSVDDYRVEVGGLGRRVVEMSLGVWE